MLMLQIVNIIERSNALSKHDFYMLKARKLLRRALDAFPLSRNVVGMLFVATIYLNDFRPNAIFTIEFSHK